MREYPLRCILLQPFAITFSCSVNKIDQSFLRLLSTLLLFPYTKKRTEFNRFLHKPREKKRYTRIHFTIWSKSWFLKFRCRLCDELRFPTKKQKPKVTWFMISTNKRKDFERRWRGERKKDPADQNFHSSRLQVATLLNPFFVWYA